VLDPQQHALAVDGGDFERDGLGNAQSGAETHHQHGAVLDAVDVVEQAADLVGAGYAGKYFLHPGAEKVLLASGHFQCDQIQKLHRGNEGVDALRGELALLDQVELVLADRLQIELVGAAVEIQGEVRDIMDIASLGSGREIAQLHVFDETSTQRCHAVAP
jgi:hypothetical protein